MLAYLTTLYLGHWFRSLAQGALVTVLIGLAGMGLGLCGGALLGTIKWLRIPILSMTIEILTLVLCSIPEILIIYLLYFGSQPFVDFTAKIMGLQSLGDAIFPFIVALTAIATIASAYISEAVRASLNIIPLSHIEAAKALGLKPWQVFWHILRPQIVRLSLPSLNNIWQNVIKDTALLSAIGMGELLRISTIGANTLGLPFIFYGVAAIFYLIITFFSQATFKAIAHMLQIEAN
ncbi:ABC transporter permease subunit [Bartonella sp. DGB2]|uniref:ABC transporter permease subunit n=1 Tax=Bartonella sp. DGB2 TaxID=3388426 RepID=UPI0039903654